VVGVAGEGKGGRRDYWDYSCGDGFLLHVHVLFCCLNPCNDEGWVERVLGLEREREGLALVYRDWRSWCGVWDRVMWRI
jgi:hypothetical protein